MPSVIPPACAVSAGINVPAPSNPATVGLIAPSPPVVSNGTSPFSFRQANYEFAVRLYQELGKHKPGNLIFSPLTIQLGLGKLWAASEGQTEKELAALLGFGAGRDQILVEAGNALGRQSACRRSRRCGEADLFVLRRLLVPKDASVAPNYHERIGPAFGGDLVIAESEDGAAARDRTNAWVSISTKRQLPEILPPSASPLLDRIVLATALYFGAMWDSPFGKATLDDWSLPSGAKVKTPTMYRRGDVQFARLVDAWVLRLGYVSVGYSFMVLMPPVGQSLESLERRLTSTALLDWTTFLDAGHLDVYLPKFTVGPRLGMQLGETLKNLGMKSAFSPGAEFPWLDRRHQHPLGEVFHDTIIQVDERGTTTTRTMPPIPTKAYVREDQFKVDRPFLCLVREEATGLILLFGRIVDPRPVGN